MGAGAGACAAAAAAALTATATNSGSSCRLRLRILFLAAGHCAAAGGGLRAARAGGLPCLPLPLACGRVPLKERCDPPKYAGGERHAARNAGPKKRGRPRPRRLGAGRSRPVCAMVSKSARWGGCLGDQCQRRCGRPAAPAECASLGASLGHRTAPAHMPLRQATHWAPCSPLRLQLGKRTHPGALQRRQRHLLPYLPPQLLAEPALR